MNDTSEDISTESARWNPTRRRFLFGTAAVAGFGVVVAACGSDDDEADDTGDTRPEAADTGNDVKVAMTAAALEVLAVSTYQKALDAATQGALGTVPPAVAEYVSTALEQHQAHLDAWNDVITGAGEAEVTEPPSDLAATVDQQFATVKDAAGAAKLARTLESIAAATYLKVAPTLSGEDARKLAGSIGIIDRQHIAILNYALGEYPVPEVFASTEESVV